MPPIPSPTPSPIEVVVHSAPAEWWQLLAALGPLAVAFGAVVAGIIGWRTLKQRAEADNRAEWWKRAQWALDAVYSGDKKRGTIGLKVLKVLGEPARRDRAMQIAAAQPREVTDRRLGKVIPEWIKALAREQPPGHTPWALRPATPMMPDARRRRSFRPPSCVCFCQAAGTAPICCMRVMVSVVPQCSAILPS